MWRTAGGDAHRAQHASGQGGGGQALLPGGAVPAGEHEAERDQREERGAAG